MSVGGILGTDISRLELLEDAAGSNRLSRVGKVTCAIKSQMIGTVSKNREIFRMYPELLEEQKYRPYINQMGKQYSIKKKISHFSFDGKPAILHHLEHGKKGGTLGIHNHGLIGTEFQNWDLFMALGRSGQNNIISKVVSPRLHHTMWSTGDTVSAEESARYVISGLDADIGTSSDIYIHGNSAGTVPIYFQLKEIYNTYPHLQGKMKVIFTGAPLGRVKGSTTATDQDAFNDFITANIGSIPGIGLGSIRLENRALTKKFSRVESLGAREKDMTTLLEKNTGMLNTLFGMFADYIFLTLSEKTSDMMPMRTNVGAIYSHIYANYADIYDICNAQGIFSETEKEIKNEKIQNRFRGTPQFWETIDNHILSKNIPKGMNKAMKKFMHTLYGKTDGCNNISDRYKQLQIEMGYKTFMKNPTIYNRFRGMAAQASRPDLVKIHRDLVSLIGPENILRIVGDQDSISDPAASRKYVHEHIHPDITFLIAPNCGHVAAQEQPERLANQTHDFISPS